VRFHLVDRIDAYSPGQWVRARKLTSVSEELWIGTASDAIMPGPLVLEALCQAGSWLVVASTEGRKRAALLQIEWVSFLDVVRPGDVLELHGEVNSMSEEIAVLSGSVCVGERLVLEAADIMCALIDAGDLEGPDGTARMRDQLIRPDALVRQEVLVRQDAL
jgi:3-hydroxyacyl-[acyl-carrier-protein] dehydratase